MKANTKENIPEMEELFRIIKRHAKNDANKEESYMS